MNMNKNIVNSEISYTGKQIKEWCKFHDNDKSEYGYYASLILHKYFGKYNKKFIPKDNVYYFVWYERYYKGFNDVYLERDTEKSPRKNKETDPAILKNDF